VFFTTCTATGNRVGTGEEATGVSVAGISE